MRNVTHKHANAIHRLIQKRMKSNKTNAKTIHVCELIKKHFTKRKYHAELFFMIKYRAGTCETHYHNCNYQR